MKFRGQDLRSAWTGYFQFLRLLLQAGNAQAESLLALDRGNAEPPVEQGKSVGQERYPEDEGATAALGCAGSQEQVPSSVCWSTLQEALYNLSVSRSFPRGMGVADGAHRHLLFCKDQEYWGMLKVRPHMKGSKMEPVQWLG